MTSSVSSTVSGSAVMWSPTRAARASAAPAANRTRSRSVRMPIGVLPSTTTTDPTRRANISAAASATLAPTSVVRTERLMMSPTVRARVGGGPAMHSILAQPRAPPTHLSRAALTGSAAATYDRAMPSVEPVTFPTMYRVRPAFTRTRLDDIPGGVARALGAGQLPIKRGDTVAVGAGSRGIAHIDVIVRATVDWLKAQGARPFVFPAMGSHGGATVEGQRSVLAHYGITEATMGCEVRAGMDVVQVGEALGLPVWLDRIASEANWIGLVNRIKPHTDFKGSIESGLFKMMTIGLGKYQGATQYHRANVNHGYETVITAVGREMLAKARIGFGLGVVENGYEETGCGEAFNAADLEAGERRLLKDARAWMARLPFPAMDVLIVEEIGKNISWTPTSSAGPPTPTSRSRPTPRSSGSWRSTSPTRAAATPPGSATPTSRPGGSRRRLTGRPPRTTPPPPAPPKGP